MVADETGESGDIPPVRSLDVSPTGALNICYGDYDEEGGVIRIFPQGYLDTDFDGIDISTSEAEARKAHAIRVWRALTNDWETQFSQDAETLEGDTTLLERFYE